MCDSECFFLCQVFPVANLSVECSDYCSQSSTSDDSYTLSLQSSITITCDNTVNTDLDSLEFTWKKDGQPLSKDEYSITHIGQEESTLMFQIVNFTDAGCYDCFIQNSVGSNSKKVHINVLCEYCYFASTPFIHSASVHACIY